MFILILTHAPFANDLKETILKYQYVRKFMKLNLVIRPIQITYDTKSLLFSNVSMLVVCDLIKKIYWRNYKLENSATKYKTPVYR